MSNTAIACGSTETKAAMWTKHAMVRVEAACPARATRSDDARKRLLSQHKKDSWACMRDACNPPTPHPRAGRGYICMAACGGLCICFLAKPLLATTRSLPSLTALQLSVQRCRLSRPPPFPRAIVRRRGR